MSDHPCTAAKVKTYTGAFGERCGKTPATETVLGFMCESCLQYARDNYDGSLLKMMRDELRKKNS